MGLSSLTQLATDQYERAARLYPALLALLPLLIAVILTSVFDKPLATQLIALSGACGAAYLLANISRMLGKSKEAYLFVKWGGMPTTQLLRHGNPAIDPHTKLRYHTFLARKLKIKFPSPDDERMSPEAADETYRAGIKWLLERTRDKKQFALLFKENISYGFHRNGYGLKWISTLFGLGSIAWLLGSFQAYAPASWPNLTSAQLVAIAVELAITMAWALYFSEARVKQSAYAYADMLLRACDSLR